MLFLCVFTFIVLPGIKCTNMDQPVSTRIIYFSIVVFVLFCLILFVCLRHCLLGYPGTHNVDQAELELGDPPNFASQVLRLKAEDVCASEILGKTYKKIM